MRYFVYTDKDNKISDLYRFDVSGKEMIEESWDGKKWVVGTRVVTDQLSTGSGDLIEVKRSVVKKWCPDAL